MAAQHLRFVAVSIVCRHGLVVAVGAGARADVAANTDIVAAARRQIAHGKYERSFLFGYGHMPVFGAIVATGAGLHVAAYYIEEQSVLTSTQTVLALAIPVALYLALIFALYSYMVRTIDTFHVVLVSLVAITLAASVVLVSAGVDMAVCLLVVMLAPIVVMP